MDGRELICVLHPGGMEQYEVEGRPDGQRPHGHVSSFDYHLERLAAQRQAGAAEDFQLTKEDCAELFDEAALYKRRAIQFFHLRDWVRAEQDTARNLRLLEFVERHAWDEADRVQSEKRDCASLNTFARALSLLMNNQADHTVRGTPAGTLEHATTEDPPRPGLRNQQGLKGSEPAPALMDHRPRRESLFVQQADYWIIEYQGQTAHLKASRGLQWLERVLRHPGQEFHVIELTGELRIPPSCGRVELNDWQASALAVTTAHGSSAGPLLDARAKSEFRQRLSELREDAAEAQQLGDSERAAIAQEEINAIVEQLTRAVGLGGRDRPVSSVAERARSAVTKRLKESIQKIGRAIPPLGRHLAATVKTGYFCSYNPELDQPVPWKFSLLALWIPVVTSIVTV
jgi:hypothetical protein